MKELKLKKCLKCNALIKVIEDCNCEDCGIVCCGEPMKDVKSNSVDAAFEKHIPVYEIEESNIVITVNHVMEEDHYIEWIIYVTNNLEITKYFKPNEELKLIVPYEKGAKIYSYCNKHGLWEKEVD